jgi:HlyD family secretion protein
MAMKTKFGRKQAGWAALAAAGIAAAAWAFWPRPLPVDVAQAQLGRFEQAIEEDGRVRAIARYVISAPTTAELARPTLKVGDRVDVGQVVASLLPAAPQMIDARTRRMLQERAGSAEAALAAAQAQVGQQQAAMARAKLDADRAGLLAGERFVSASVHDQAVLTLQAQQKALQAAQANVELARHTLAEARAALTRAEGGDSVRGMWQLKSPVAGRVTRLHHESAATVQVGQPLLEIADTSRLEAVIDVLSSDALRIHAGAPVRLSLGAGTPALTAHVVRVEPVAFTKVSALGIDEQRVNVIVHADDLVSPALAAGDGFRVEANVTVAAHDNVLLVPAAALRRDGARWAVMVLEGGRARLRAIEVAERNADVAWLRGGVAAGERVVLYPDASIADGQRVRARDDAG